MSNPVGAYIVYELYDECFRNQWLAQALSADEYSNIHALAMPMLRELYPTIYIYGPQGPQLYMILHQLNNRLDTWLAPNQPSQQITAQRFFGDLTALNNARPEPGAAMLSDLRTQMRPTRFHINNDPFKPAGESERLTHHSRHLGRILKNQPPHRLADAADNLETLLTDIMLLDIWATHYPAHRQRLLAFLTTWQLLF